MPTNSRHLSSRHFWEALQRLRLEEAPTRQQRHHAMTWLRVRVAGRDIAMTTTPDLDRVWTRADVAEALRAQGIGLSPRADGYRVNFIKGGTTQTEYVTDDLIDALVTGLEMAEHPPAPPPQVRRGGRRSVWRGYSLRYNGELRKKLRKRRRSRTK